LNGIAPCRRRILAPRSDDEYGSGGALEIEPGCDRRKPAVILLRPHGNDLVSEVREEWRSQPIEYGSRRRCGAEHGSQRQVPAPHPATGSRSAELAELSAQTIGYQPLERVSREERSAESGNHGSASEPENCGNK
jgi:hypothetical protein